MWSPKTYVRRFNSFLSLCSVICFYASCISSPLGISNRVISLSFASNGRVAAGAEKFGGELGSPVGLFPIPDGEGTAGEVALPPWLPSRDLL